MKSHITLALAIFLLCFISSSAQTSFSLPISSVEIHQDGARIVHSGPVQLKTTVCTIEISDLAHDLDFNSISIDMPEGSSLESISFDVRARPSSHTNELSMVLESLSKLDVKTRMLEAVLHTYKEEQLFLSANRSIGSSQEVLLVDDVIEMADFLRERNQSLALDILDVSLDIESLELESAELEARKTALELVGSDLEGVITLVIKKLHHPQERPEPHPQVPHSIRPLGPRVRSEFLLRRYLCQALCFSHPVIRPRLVVSAFNPHFRPSFGLSRSITIRGLDYNFHW